MAKMAKMERNPATPAWPMILASLFAVTSVTYALLFSEGILFDLQSSQWNRLWLGRPREPQPSKHSSDNWLMQTRHFRPNHYQAYPYVANGYFGQTLPAEGVGYWIQQNRSTVEDTWSINNWPLDEPRATFGTVAGFYDHQKRTNRIIWPPNLERGGESVISGIPDWTGLVVTTATGSSYLPGVDDSTVREYHQSMSLRNGLVQTNVTWIPNGENATFQLNFTVLAHQKNINLGLVRLDLTVSKESSVTVTDILDGAGATRTNFKGKSADPDKNLIWTSVRPIGLEGVVAFEYSTVGLEAKSQEDQGAFDTMSGEASRGPWISKNDSTVSQSWNLKLQAGLPVTLYKYVGIASTDAFPRNAQSIARHTALTAKKMKWADLVQTHNEAWDILWESADITIPDSNEIQKTARASLFHLLANLRPGGEGPGLGDNSISPSGLTSDSYGGYVFWDADSWVATSLLALHPDRAMSINNYRSKMHEQAMKNSKINEGLEFSGALFPWTSGRFGNCTGNGICAGYQYHINADIAMAHWHYFLHTNDLDWLRRKAWPIIFNAAEMFVSFVQFSLDNSQGMFWSLAVTDPDEDAIQVNDGAYTNTAIKLLLGTWGPNAAKLLNIPIPTAWEDIARNITIPTNTYGDLIEEYSGMPGDIVIKQADVVLINYPLEYYISAQIARNNMEYYALRSSPLGPQMTWSTHSISEAQLQTSGCASYTYLLYSSEPYMRAPFFQFSELLIDDASINGGTEPAFPFLTGHGGYLQIFTHGLTGMRPRHDAFYLDPSLPPQLGDSGVQVRGMKWQGAVFDVNIQLDHTTIYRRKSGKSSVFARNTPATVRIGGDNPKAGDYALKRGEFLVVPTRRPDLNTQGNHALCKSVNSWDAHTTGRFPLSAVDGSASSIWQPTSASLPASLIIDLGLQVKNLTRVEINWGAVPAVGFSVSLRGEDRDVGQLDGESWNEVLKVQQVMISAPFEQERVKEVRMLDGNSSTGTFKKVQGGRYVKLAIWGTQGVDKDAGATVAEFRIY